MNKEKPHSEKATKDLETLILNTKLKRLEVRQKVQSGLLRGDALRRQYATLSNYVDMLEEQLEKLLAQLSPPATAEMVGDALIKEMKDNPDLF